MRLFAVRRVGLRVMVSFISAVAMVAVSTAYAQPSAVLGVVTDSAGNPMYGARVSVVGTSLVAMSDERGEFRIVGIMPSPVDLQARRLGFSPSLQRLSVTPQESQNRVHFRLSAVPGTMTPVVVQASRVKYTGRLAGYYERLRRRTNGTFISRDEIDRKSYRTLSQLLAQTPGVNAMRGRSGMGVVRMRGRGCRPLVWLDGTPMPAGEVDLDAFSASTLHGIELYLGSSNAPMDYTAPLGQSSCGTILLWSRGRDTEIARAASRPTADLETMVASLAIYTSEQVDRPAVLSGSKPLEVLYPLSLFAGGVSGRVMVEFVVDTLGKIEEGTLAIVSSPHPLFTEAVTTGLERATFAPASKNGRAVRQIVHQPFAFSAGTAKPRKEGPG